MLIKELTDERYFNSLEKMLLDAFDDNDWLTDIKESIKPERISLIAIGDDNDVIGWIGGISQYNGNVWELHPLVVKKEFRMKGIGKKLVEAFEEKVKERGGITVWLGSDDEDESTSLSNVDLYTDVTKSINTIQNYKKHPFEFYQKLGYTIVGVMPDANGIGKPDIFMAKRVLDEKKNSSSKGLTATL